MKLLILGASGGCGRWATRLAIERGHSVRVLVREATRFDPPAGVEMVRGDVLDRRLAARLLDDVEAVLSCIGIRRRQPRNPWSRIISPPDLATQVAQLLCDEMSQRHITRLVAISAGGVGDSAAHVSPINRWLFGHSNIGVAYRDLEGMERALADSSLDWQAVRPTTLTNAGRTNRARVVERYGLMTRISRADVATWMLDAVAEPENFSNRTPMIASEGVASRGPARG